MWTTAPSPVPAPVSRGTAGAAPPESVVRAGERSLRRPRRICRRRVCREKALPARERAGRRLDPVAVTCRVLKLARQPYYRWLAAGSPTPRSCRPIGPMRCSTRIATTRSSATGSWPRRHVKLVSRWPSGLRGGSAAARFVERVRQETSGKTERSVHRCTTM